MSYEFYKILHYVFLFIFVTGITSSFLNKDNPKILKILTGVSSLVIFVAGMGLIVKGLGIGHGEAWPKWLVIKIVLWLLVSILGPVLSKRLTSNRGLALSGILALIFIAVSMAVLKPF